MAFAVPLYTPTSTPFGTPSHHYSTTAPPFSKTPATPQLFFTPTQPRTYGNAYQYPGRDPFAFPSSPHSDQAEPPTPQNPPTKSAEPPQHRTKGFRYSSYAKVSEFRPLTSSPLAHSSLVVPDKGGDIMDDDDDDNYDSHHPSSPLGRVSFSSATRGASTSSVSAFNLDTSSSTRRRFKTPGDEDEDADDPVNPSPLLQRRRAQYKSTGYSILSMGRRRIPGLGMPPSSSPSSSPPVAALFEKPRPVDTEEDPRRAFLRARLKKTYFSRATKAREKAVKARRRHVEGAGPYFAGGEGRNGASKGKGKAVIDDEDVGMDGDESDDEENDDQILNDELFSRIMANMNRKEQYSYRISYAREVGSSFDPDIEDVSRWEEELKSPPQFLTASFPSRPSQQFPPSSSSSSPPYRPDLGSSPPRAPTEYDGDDEIDLADIEDAEIEAYAEEYARVMEEQEHQHQQSTGRGTGGYDDVLEGLEDLPEEELFGAWNWSESEGEGGGFGDEGDVDMDIS